MPWKIHMSPEWDKLYTEAEINRYIQTFVDTHNSLIKNIQLIPFWEDGAEYPYYQVVIFYVEME